MGWQVEDFKKFEKNTLKGFFSLNISGMIVEGFSYHEKNGKRWVGFPAREKTDDNGDTQWFPIVKFLDPDRQAKFQSWAKAEVRKIMPATKEETPLEKDDLPF